MKEEYTMTEIRSLGKIDIKILEEEYGKIQTDEIIVTNERINHIKGRHPEDFEKFCYDILSDTGKKSQKTVRKE